MKTWTKTDRGTWTATVQGERYEITRYEGSKLWELFRLRGMGATLISDGSLAAMKRKALQDAKERAARATASQIVTFTGYTMGNGEHPRCLRSSTQQAKKLAALFKLASELGDWEKAFVRSNLY